MKVTISYGGSAATAQGATRKNGGAWILEGLGWYWLNSVQAYVFKGPLMLPAVDEAVTALRAAGFVVELDA